MQSIEQVVNVLGKHGLRLCTAESCTAGLIAALVADIPGSGAVLDCGFVTYSEQAKQRCLGVDPQTIERFGLTSEEVAREMALGLEMQRRRYRTGQYRPGRGGRRNGRCAVHRLCHAPGRA